MTRQTSLWATMFSFIKNCSGLSTTEYGVLFAAGMMVTIPAANTLYTAFRDTVSNTQTTFQQPDMIWTTHHWGSDGDVFVDITTGSGYHRYEINQNGGADKIYTLGTTDVIAFGEGITADMLSYSIVDGSLVINYGSGTVTNEGCHHPQHYCVEGIQLADGTSINPTQAHIVIDGRSSADQGLYGMSYNNGGGNEFHLGLGSGHDTISTYMSTDTIIFDANVDPGSLTFHIVDGSMVISYGNQGDTVTIDDCHYRGEEAGEGNFNCAETLQFLANNTSYNPNAQPMEIYASENSGTLYGMSYYDSINNFYIDAADGDKDIWTVGDSVTDTLNLSGYNPKNTWTEVVDNNLLIHNNETGNTITVTGCSGDVAVDGTYGPGNCIETISFDDGTVWTFDGAGEYDGGRLGGGGGGGGILSDMRLKHDIRPAGKLANGVKLYTYKYLNDEKVFVGVMAQDLLSSKRLRNSVIRLPSGYYMVNYRKLGMEPANRQEMIAAGKRAHDYALKQRKQSQDHQKDI
ncbi:MAG: calcium-binding protein [Pseudomonadota bacterium]